MNQIEIDDDMLEDLRGEIAFVTAEPTSWLVECDGCLTRLHVGVVYLVVIADIHLCGRCLLAAREVIDQALRAVDHAAVPALADAS